MKMLVDDEWVMQKILEEPDLDFDVGPMPTVEFLRQVVEVNNAKDALMALNSGWRKQINPRGGQQAMDDYCDRKFTLYCALEAHKETIRNALQKVIDHG